MDNASRSKLALFLNFSRLKKLLSGMTVSHFYREVLMEMVAGLVKAIPASLRCLIRPVSYSDFIF